MENKQTAVEWLVKMLHSPVCVGFIQGRKQIPHHIIEQAKQMEKEQKLDFASKVLNKAECSWTGIVHINESLEDIYNETYGK
jgi:hypothetical protein